MTTCSDFAKMAFSCNRYRLIVVILLSLIMWQLFSMFPGDSAKTSTKLAQSGIVELEDDKFNIHKQDKVKVRVYYEALCPDSKHFFVRHLWPVTEKLSEFLEIALIPYGKATTKEENGQYSFHCQHGETECYANKIHACSIETIGNMTTSVKFTECMISDNSDPDEALTRCAKSMNVDMEPISTCATGELGSALLKKYGDDTQIINPYFIPTITLNGSKPKQTLPAILKNFLLEVFSDEIKEIIQHVHNECVSKTGTSEEDIANCENGIFKEDPKLKCYMFCLMEEASLVDEEDNVDYDMMVSLIPEQHFDRVSKMIFGCKHLDTPDKDKCQRAFDVHKCSYQKDPDFYFLF